MTSGKLSANTADNIKVGELLTQACIVSSSELTEAIQVARRLGVPIGRTLLMSGFVREDVLDAALAAQSLLKSSQVPLHAVVNALRHVHESKISFGDALKRENLNADYSQSIDKLAELLLDSNIVAAEDLEKAIEKSVTEGIPLGSALVLQGILSPALFPSLQRIQAAWLSGNLSQDEAIKAVQKTFLLWLKAEESLFRANKPKGEPVLHEAPETLPAVSAVNAQDNIQDFRLVDLLKASEIFSQRDVQQKYEAMLQDSGASASFFIHLGLLTPEQAQSALYNFEQLKSGKYDKAEAIAAVQEGKTAPSGNQAFNATVIPAAISVQVGKGDLAISESSLPAAPVTVVAAEQSAEGATEQEVVAKQESEAAVASGKRPRVKRSIDPATRGRVAKVIGGALAGVVVAGIFAKRPKGK
jgi:hypothetical protein